MVAAGEKAILEKGLEEGVASNVLCRASDDDDGLRNDSMKGETVGKGREDIIFSSFCGENGSLVLGEKFCVVDFHEQGSVRRERKCSTRSAGRKSERA